MRLQSKFLAISALTRTILCLSVQGSPLGLRYISPIIIECLTSRQFCLSKTCHSKSHQKKCTIFLVVLDQYGKLDCAFAFQNPLLTVLNSGNKNATRGTAYVVYESPQDAKIAVDKLNGFSFGGRFLVVLFHQLDKVVKPEDLVTRQEELERLKKQYNVS